MIRRSYHGKVNTPEYRSWRGMVERCENPSHRQYADYGSIGITVCVEWRNSFPKFLADMGECPAKCTLDRIDNTKGYYKSNCRWATRKEQNRNKRNNRRLEAFGEIRTLAEWCELLGLNHVTVISRIDRDGLTVEEALTRRVGVRSASRTISFAGETLTLTEWAKRLETTRSTLQDRIDSGMSDEECISKPIRRKKQMSL